MFLIRIKKSLLVILLSLLNLIPAKKLNYVSNVMTPKHNKAFEPID